MIKKISRYFIFIFVGLLVACADHRSETELLALISAKMQAKDFELANIELKNLLQRFPDSQQGRHLLGNVSLMLGNYAEAIRQYDWLEEQQAMQPDGYLEYGRALLLNYDYQRLLSVVDVNQFSTGAQQIQALLLRAESYAATDQYDAAAKEFNAALKIDQNSVSALLGLARIALNADDYLRAQLLSDRAAKIDPDSIDVKMLQAGLAFKQQHWQQTETLYQSLVTQANLQAMPASWVMASTSLVQTYVMQKKMTEANVLADELLKQFPNSPAALYAAGLAAYHVGNLVAAEDHLLLAVKCLPEHREAILLLGAVKYGLGNYEQARMYLNNYLVYQPGNLRAKNILAAIAEKTGQDDVDLSYVTDNTKNAAQLIALGRASLNAGEFDKGIGFFQTLFASNPSDENRMQLAMAYLSVHDYDKVHELLAGFSKDNTNNIGRHLLELSLALQQNNQDAATKYIEQMLKESPDGASQFNLAASVMQAFGQDAEALRYYEKSLQLTHHFLPALVNRARLLRKQGHLPEAANDYANIASQRKDARLLLEYADVLTGLGRGSEARALIEQALYRENNNPQVYLYKIGFLLDTDDLDGALLTANEALRTLPGSAPLHNALGIIFLRKTDFNQAVKQFEKAFQLSPTEATYAINAVRSLLLNKDDVGAQTRLKRLEDAMPDNFMVNLAQVSMALHQDDQAAALSWLVLMQKKWPEDARIDEVMGDVYVNQQDTQQAYAAYSEAYRKSATKHVLLKQFFTARQLRMAAPEKHLVEWLSAHPDDDKLTLLLAKHMHVSGDLKKAEALYQKILKNNQSNPEVLNNLALLYLQEKDVRAQEYAKKAYQINPDSAEITDTYGWVLLLANRVDVAMPLLSKAAQDAPQNFEIQYHYAWGLAKNRQYDLAMSLVDSLLKREMAGEQKQGLLRLKKSIDKARG